MIFRVFFIRLTCLLIKFELFHSGSSTMLSSLDNHIAFHSFVQFAELAWGSYGLSYCIVIFLTHQSGIYYDYYLTKKCDLCGHRLLTCMPFCFLFQKTTWVQFFSISSLTPPKQGFTWPLTPVCQIMDASKTSMAFVVTRQSECVSY